MNKLLYLLILPITLFLLSCGGGGSIDELDPIDPIDPYIDTSIYTYTPDDVFEQFLIDNGFDTVLDNKVLTSNIEMVNELNFYSYSVAEIDFTGLQNFISLETLQIQQLWVGLESNFPISKNVDLSKMNNLEFFSCFSSFLDEINVSNNTLLNTLYVNGSFTTIDLSNNNNIERLWVTAELTSLNVSNMPNLHTLMCYNNKISYLDLSQNLLLSHLQCQGNPISSLDLSKNTVLSSLDCRSTNLSFLDVRNGNNQVLSIPPSGIPGIGTANNPFLFCINVDDSTFSTNNWNSPNHSSWYDPQHYFSESCP